MHLQCWWNVHTSLQPLYGSEAMQAAQSPQYLLQIPSFASGLPRLRTFNSEIHTAADMSGSQQKHVSSDQAIRLLDYVTSRDV